MILASSTLSSNESLCSFDGWINHAHLPSHEGNVLKEAFCGVLTGGQRWKNFKMVVHSTIHNNPDLEFRIFQEAKNAFFFPRIGRFYSWLNSNGQISSEKQRVISQVVRGILFTYNTASVSPEDISDKAEEALKNNDCTEGLGDGIAQVIGQLQAITVFSSSRLPGDRKKSLAAIFYETQRASEHGYRSPRGQYVKIDPASVAAMKNGTEVVYGCPLLKNVKRKLITHIDVVNADSLSVAKEIVDREGIRPLVLNLANARSPGGGVLGGSKAQEEDIMRCTNYFLALFPELNPTLAQQLPHDKHGVKYRIPEIGAILTPRVTVFRDGSNNYKFLETPFEVDMLASAAYDLNPGRWGGPRGSAGPEGKPSKALYQYEKGTKEKIRTQLTIAANSGYTSLVLGAFGCGTLLNKAEDIAVWYKEFLDDDFYGVFDTVIFAVQGGSMAAGRNFDVFSMVFASRTGAFSSGSTSTEDMEALSPILKCGSPMTIDVNDDIPEIDGLREGMERLKSFPDSLEKSDEADHLMEIIDEEKETAALPMESSQPPAKVQRRW